MNRNGERRTLREIVAGWLRALARRLPGRAGGRPAPGAVENHLPGVDAAPGADATAPQGPPAHWLALTQTKRPPEGWLRTIRERLGAAWPQVKWLGGRATPPQVLNADRQPPASQEAIPATPPVVEGRTEPPAAVRAPHVAETHRGVQPATRPATPPKVPEPVRPASKAPVALRLHPVAQGKPAAGRPPAAPIARQAAPPETPEPVRPAGSIHFRPQSQPELDVTRQPEWPPPPRQPYPGPTPIAEAPAEPSRPAVPEGAAPQPPPAFELPPHWPEWPRLPAEERASSPRAPARPFRLEPTQQERSADDRFQMPGMEPAQPEAGPGWAPQDWPAWIEPEAVVRQPAPQARPGAIESPQRWPALDRPDEPDLAEQEWETYQRAWQHAERLQREQQGQLWSEWPF